MKKDNKNSESLFLRQKAEELLKKKLSKTDSSLSAIETAKLIHELVVHQIELELQNKELIQARSNLQELAEKYSRIDLLIDRTGIQDLKEKYPSQISGGEAQRVALVRALVNNPLILLADEPTGSLDSKNADILGELLLEMNKEFGVTLLIATHSIDLAKKMSKILHIEDGKLVAHPVE